MEQILPKRTCPERAKMMMFLNEVNHITHSKSATSCRSRTRHFKLRPAPQFLKLFLPISHPRAPEHFSVDIKPQEGRAEVAHKAEHPQPCRAGISPTALGRKIRVRWALQKRVSSRKTSSVSPLTGLSVAGKARALPHSPSSCQSNASLALCRPERLFCSCCLQKNQSYGQRSSAGNRAQARQGTFIVVIMSYQGSNTPSQKRLAAMDDL